eukprot:599921-Karenia_brevis.AAC.1
MSEQLQQLQTDAVFARLEEVHMRTQFKIVISKNAGKDALRAQVEENQNYERHDGADGYFQVSPSCSEFNSVVFKGSHNSAAQFF